MVAHLRATGRHLPYEIVCHPTQVNVTGLQPSQLSMPVLSVID